jgi:predicted RNA methylase
LEVLDATVRVADSLRDESLQQYDMVIGNPPWGSDLDGWTDEELLDRFPDCGEEKDSLRSS